MSSLPCRLAVLFIVLVGSASANMAQSPPAHMVFQPNYAKAQQLAKSTGLPVLAVVLAKGGKPPASFADARVVVRSQSFLNVTLPEGGAVSKTIDGAVAGGVVFLDDGGKVLSQIEPGFSAEQFLEKTTSVMDEARSRVLKRLNDDKESVAVQKRALDSYVLLGAGVADLTPLLTHKNAALKSAVGKFLAARNGEGADWALLNAMASHDSEYRAACYSTALEVTRATKVQPVKFWKEASEEERSAALEKWRETAYGKMSPVNKAILDFTFANYGKKVNNGECATLAEDALKAAKGQPIRHERETYVWGRALASGETVQAGDIVQLEGAKFSNGVSAPHHTQIVSRVLAPGRYEVLEQNAGGRRTVGLGKLDLKLLTKGTVVIYRPLPIEGDNK